MKRSKVVANLSTSKAGEDPLNILSPQLYTGYNGATAKGKTPNPENLAQSLTAVAAGSY